MMSFSKRRVIISCLNSEVALIVDPIESLQPERIYLIHYLPDEVVSKSMYFPEFFDEVLSRLEKYGIPVEDRVGNIGSYPEMMRVIIRIIETELPKDGTISVFLNISSGTPEYVAAAAICASMYSHVSMLTADAVEFARKPEEIKAPLFSPEGVPVGTVKVAGNPIVYPIFLSDPPEDNQVKCLKEFSHMLDNGQPTNTRKIIDRLREMNLWNYEPRREAGRGLPQKESMYLKRHYLDWWLCKGWIHEDELSGKPLITESGRMIIMVFCPEE